ncbi:MAG: helix-turn-helix transcriptional regulator [Lachnospiraceae bacterium]|nr:helix-turn-helix transcriptional regulator [Lachnospiraceae bacterium]
MVNDEIIRLIEYERRKRKISIQDLVLGVCDESNVQRMERGERYQDFFVLERLIERLGISVNKLELLYDMETYNLCAIRERIEKAIIDKNYDLVEEELQAYQGVSTLGSNLHKQYILKIRAILEEKVAVNYVKSAEYLWEALLLTVPNFDIENIRKYRMGEEEVILLLMWLNAKRISDDFDILKYNDSILVYIEYNFTDEEVKANVYSKAAWLFAEEHVKNGEFLQALVPCLKSERLLTENGLLLHLQQILDLILVCFQNIDRKQYQEWKLQAAALRWVYGLYDETDEIEEIALWKNYRLNGAYLIPEVIGQERRLKGMSQEKVADILEIDQKTISRIERGKTTPRRETFRKLKKYFQFEKNCGGKIVTRNFTLLALERDIVKAGYNRDYELMEELYQNLKIQLDTKESKNRQYVLYMDTCIKMLKEEMDVDEAISNCEVAFHLTEKNVSFEKLDQIVLSQNEVLIVNYMALLYDRKEQREKGIILREKVKKAYENSKVDKRYHYQGIALVNQNLCVAYAKAEKFDDVVSACDEGVRFDLYCRRGLQIGGYLMRKAYAKVRIDGDKEACRQLYQQAYQLMKLMRNWTAIEILKKYYRLSLGEEFNI